MNNIQFISEKTCQICNVNKGSIKIALDYIEAFKYRNTSNNPDWDLNVKRINKYNNGDYKDFIDEYNAHWCCLPKVNQIDYNERIEKINKNKKLNNNKYIIEKLENKNNELKKENKELKTILNGFGTDQKDKMIIEILQSITFLREMNDVAIDKLKYENKKNKETIIEQEEIIKQLLENLEIKNKSIFQNLFSN